ncbi:MAG: HAMP domain-containing sensor histidine kinase, partial [Spirochaetota bacterium]
EKQRAIVRHSLNRIRDVANSLLERNRRQQDVISVASSDTGGAAEVRLLSGIINSVITEKRVQYGSKPGIDIDFKPTRETYGLFAVIQPVEFGRVLSNLVNNAVEALDDRGKVDVRLAEEGDRVILTIADDGKGIPPEILAKLGKKGETHGKAGGSGLGLFHARTMAESWGGSLTISSTPGEGTVVAIKLPRAEPPVGFVAAVELVPGRPVVVLDDDKGIHGLWQKKLEPLGLKEHDIEILFFSEPESLRAWTKSEPVKAKAALCLFDYELSGHKETGLSLAEEQGLCPRTILVTGRSEEKRIIEACARLKVRSIPKNLLEFVPVKVGALSMAVLIDDDAIVHMNWETAAEEAGIELKSYRDPAEFLADLEAFSRATPVYIDSELGADTKGEDVAAALKEKGFTNLTLVTGYSPERFAHLSWLKVRGKESPWRA